MKSSSAAAETGSEPTVAPSAEAGEAAGQSAEIERLRAENAQYAHYIRSKTNQLLQVMGTQPLRPEEFDDRQLLSLDPIGIIAGSFEQVLEHVNDTISQLSEARDELQAIFDATGVGISIIDNDFRVIKCNEKQRELLVDRDLAAVAGRYCYNVYCQRDGPGLDCPAMETFATGKPVMVREVQKRNKYFQVISTPFARDLQGEVTRVIEVSLDITEKKRAEQEEQRQRGFYLTEKLKFATVLESLSEGLLVVDTAQRVVSANTAAATIIGRNKEELMARELSSLFTMLSASDDGKGLAAAGEGICNFEITHARDDGSRLLAVNSVPLQDAGASSIGRVLTIRDITEEKQRRETYYRAEKLAAVGQLSAGLAHELNTPLGSILGYARLLLRQDNFTAEQRDRLALIAQQAKKSNTIIQGLLNFARVSTPAGKNESRCDPNRVIGEALQVLAAELGQRGIEVRTALAEVPRVVIDAKQLEQVVLNMLLNSLQAMKESGGDITIATTARGNRLQLSIADNGPGIPPEIQSRIFDPFFTTKEVGEGTGLGLSICSGIINEFGGAIDVDSEIGHGTTFTITLYLEQQL
ncbi:MAG: ATP-binding protein [Desulfurivibrio sp.]|nr:ATP-binding protein [Desulfurivibrio sp.]